MVTPSGLDTSAPPAWLASSAHDDALAAARHARVVVRPLTEMADLERASLLAARVWRSPDTGALESSLLRALEHSGNYVAGVFDRDDAAHMIGMSVGFRTGVPASGLHSHMTCTAEGRRGSGLGAALKLHQRAWALGQGLATITWTFDPLVARNAYFNLDKLGATVRAYLPNFYGSMTDGLNAGDESDRLLVGWDLAGGPTPRVPAFRPTDGTVLLAVGADGEPTHGAAEGPVVACQVPTDVVELRALQSAVALEWRRALRASLLGALSDGYRITGFDRAGYYVLTRGHPAT
jgi:predicted GNAT superfamily acetyltransferase